MESLLYCLPEDYGWTTSRQETFTPIDVQFTILSHLNISITLLLSLYKYKIASWYKYQDFMSKGIKNWIIETNSVLIKIKTQRLQIQAEVKTVLPEILDLKSSK